MFLVIPLQKELLGLSDVSSSLSRYSFLLIYILVISEMNIL